MKKILLILSLNLFNLNLLMTQEPISFHEGGINHISIGQSIVLIENAKSLLSYNKMEKYEFSGDTSNIYFIEPTKIDSCIFVDDIFLITNKRAKIKIIYLFMKGEANILTKLINNKLGKSHYFMKSSIGGSNLRNRLMWVTGQSNVFVLTIKQQNLETRSNLDNMVLMIYSEDFEDNIGDWGIFPRYP